MIIQLKFGSIRNIKQFMVIAFLFVFSGCNQNTVQEDMKAYCECIRENKNNIEGRELCYQLMEEIIKRYEFNPQAMKELVDEAEKCY